MSYFDGDNDDKYLYGSDNEEKKDEQDDDIEEVEEEEEEEDEDEQIGGAEDEDDDEVEIEEKKQDTKVIKELPTTTYKYDGDDDEEDEDDDEDYLKKFDKELNENYLVNFHPECVHHNYDEILALTNIIRNKDNIIIDDLHRTIPYLTKYERARILGQRTKQINSGATPFVKVPENVIDGYLIAELELKEKRIPFIIRRPLPNGGSEYWKVSDLENILY